MKHLKTFESYVDSAEDMELYDEMRELLDEAEELCNCEIYDPMEAIEALEELGTDEALSLSIEIQELEELIDEVESEAYYKELEEQEEEKEEEQEDEEEEKEEEENEDED